MKKLVLIFAAIIAASQSFGQVNFENLTLTAPNNFWKGMDTIPTQSNFSSGGATFRNKFDTSSFGGYWSGWGYSALNDTISTSYATNELGCAAGKGQNGSDKYGVAYISSLPYLNRITFNTPVTPTGMYLTNTTIAYKSMKNGDAFAKKFGGPNGNDPDFFRLRVTGWHNGSTKTDTINIYLADFRDTNNTNDYILKDWTWFNTSALGLCDSIIYTMESTDTAFGYINTPLYFCMDNLTFFGTGIKSVNEYLQMDFYPNPFQNELKITNKTEHTSDVKVFDMTGKLMAHTMVSSFSASTLNTEAWATGTYLVHVKNNGEQYQHKLLK